MTGLTKRVNRGSGHRYQLDGEDCPGVTTLIGNGMPKPQLKSWAARMAADYAIEHWDTLSALSLGERQRRIHYAYSDATNRAAVRGTKVHEFAERLARGEAVEVPEPLSGYVDAYLAFAADWRPRELLVEAVVLSRRYWFMGTLDLIAQLADERTWALDFKTTASAVYPEAALQLSAYTHAEAYIDAAGTEQPLPPVDAAGVVWLHADGAYQLVPVDAGDETFWFFLHTAEVAVFAKSDKEQFVLPPLDPPARAVA